MSQVTVVPLERPASALTLQLGLEAPRFTNGYAKWNEITRPRRRNMLEFESESLGKLAFDVLIDQWPDGDIENIIGTVFTWAARMELPFQPPLLKISGPVPYPGLTYVLTNIDDSGLVERNGRGARCRQQLKLEFTEYQAPDLIGQAPPPAQAAQHKAGLTAAPAQKVYVVKRGDTLSSIAARLYGDVNKWHAIAEVNGLRDPKQLRVAQVLRLP